MGGTFDPIHQGHLLIAAEARHEFELETVVFVPAGTPPHKGGRPLSGTEHRYVMVNLAIADDVNFVASRIEIDRQGSSFAVDTLRHFVADGRNPEEIYFITGADTILEILTWHNHAEAVQLCTFVAATRPGFDLSRLDAALPPGYRERIRTIATPAVDISSTDIRERVRSGRNIDYLVPRQVATYISKHRLYMDA